MGVATKIQWTHHTFNPWWGCAKVSRGCQSCYAEAWAKFTGNAVWGKDAPRRFFGDKHWLEPLKWNRAAEMAGERRRVFCASMADVFEDRPDLVETRERLWDTIYRTPHLDWLLLTKRPENIARMLPPAWVNEGSWPSLWLGTTVENRAALARVDILRAIPASVRFLSVEPNVEDLGDFDLAGIHWVIHGGESGGHAAPFSPWWARRLRDKCRRAGVAYFLKQQGSHVADFNDSGYEGDTPESWPMDTRSRPATPRDDGYQHAPVRVLLKDSHGGDPSEWPEDLRVRQFPVPA